MRDDTCSARPGQAGGALDTVMDGALQAVIDSCITADEEARLAALAGDEG
ncbi:hypothetical protein [Agrococcus sp. KRD186]|nr:hypothetical protein [Agrococcus sp. KRD186]